MLPLARLRARGELTELRAADLRFSPDEAADFLGRVMGLDLAAEDIAALESRTEGWIAGLQLAALSLQGQKDIAGFIRLVHRQPPLRAGLPCRGGPAPSARGRSRPSSCGPPSWTGSAARSATPSWRGSPGRRPWSTSSGPTSSSCPWTARGGGIVTTASSRASPAAAGAELHRRQGRRRGPGAAALHIRASCWFEDNGLPIDAFRHAAAAADIDRAERLARSREMPLHFRGAVIEILDWLASLPESVLDARPSLRVLTATMSLVAGRTTGVEEALQAAERALPGRRAGRSGPRPHRPHRRCPGHPRPHPLPAGRHRGPVSSGARAPAPRRPSLPLHGHVDHGLRASAPGGSGSRRPGLPSWNT